MWTVGRICEIPPPESAKYWTLCSSSANGCKGGSADGSRWMMIIHAYELNGVFTCGGISVWELPLFCQAAISAVLSSFAWLCLGYLKPWWKYRWLGGSQTGWGHSWASQWQSHADQYSQDCITEWLWGYLFSNGKQCWKNCWQTKRNLLLTDEQGGFYLHKRIFLLFRIAIKRNSFKYSLFKIWGTYHWQTFLPIHSR